jgi:co-chaperonin GroES (HSP10)
MTVATTQERIIDKDTGLVTGVRDVEVPESEAPAVRDDRLTEEEFEKALPKPVGWKILVALPKVDKQFEGSSLIKVDTTMHNEQVTSVVGLVLDVGPDAYSDKTRFPSGAWCKPGDYVLVGPYKGQRFILNGEEFRMMNDDSIEGVVPDPRGYRRI